MIIALKTKYLFFCIVLLSVLLFSCQNKENKIEKALENVIDRFPQLPKNEGELIDFYLLERTVIIGERNIELQLRSSPRDINNDRQQIIIFKNQENEYYTIPLFSNIYKDYWNFKFDNIENGLKANTTFESEFNKAMDILNLHDTLGYLGNVQEIIDEMFYSLLWCKEVSMEDTTYLNMMTSVFNKSLEIESVDSCKVMAKKNVEDIKHTLKQTDSIPVFIIWDRNNNRVCQISNVLDMMNKEKLDSSHKCNF